jgi:hypothetical protein
MEKLKVKWSFSVSELFGHVTVVSWALLIESLLWLKSVHNSIQNGFKQVGAGGLC